MPFIRANFCAIGGQSRKSTSGTGESTPGAPQIWSYRTQDATATVDTAGYFNEVRQLLEVGDLILRCTINSSGVVQTIGWHVVVDKSATAVDVADTAAIAITDTD